MNGGYPNEITRLHMRGTSHEQMSDHEFLTCTAVRVASHSVQQLEIMNENTSSRALWRPIIRSRLENKVVLGEARAENNDSTR